MSTNTILPDISIKNRIIKDAEETKKIRTAFENKEFVVYLQPKFSIGTGKIVGAEALARWIQADGIVNLPSAFFPLLEKKDLVRDLDKYVLKIVCATIRKWIASGVGYLPISINCSGKNIGTTNFVEDYADIADECFIPHEYIELEFSESTVHEKQEGIEKLIEQLHEAKFKIAVDNFGSQLSSVGLLKNLKFDTIKLDRNFFVNSKDATRGELIRHSITQLAQNLNMTVVAEGVETAEQYKILRIIECDAVQGYYCSEPVCIEDFETKFAKLMPKQAVAGTDRDLPVPMLSKNENRKFDSVLNILNAINTPAIMFNAGFRQFKCNSNALDLFKMDSISDWQIEFFRLSPEYQPDGEYSLSSFFDIIETLAQKGSFKALWMHCDIQGNEIPCEIHMNKLHLLNDSGEELFVGLINDMRSQLPSYEDTDDQGSNDFFLNSITDKMLFNIVTGLSDEWFFSYDINYNTVQYFGSGSERMNLPKGKHDLSHTNPLEPLVYHEDKGIFDELIATMKSGTEETFEIRLSSPEGELSCYRFMYHIVKNKEETSMYAVGKATDISEQKQLEGMAQRDLMTGCYNKISTENFIKRTLTDESHQSHALFVIDIDDFKGINDNLGHAFGDEVLKDVAKNLHGYFRDKDIIGRIGGDEFVVFIKNIDSMDVLVQKAQCITNAFKASYTGENKDHKVSGSVGVAQFPRDAATFEELFHNADKALYRSKVAGKDCYTFYSQNTGEGTMKSTSLVNNVSRSAASYFDAELVGNVYDILYTCKDYNVAVKNALACLGERMGVDRCYLFETKDEGSRYSQNHIWVKAGISSEQSFFQNIPREKLAEFIDDLETHGAFYCNDFSVMKTQTAREVAKQIGLKSVLLLQAQECEKGYIPIFIGFDDCYTPRIWTIKELNTARYILKILSIFLLSEKATVNSKKVSLFPVSGK